MQTCRLLFSMKKALLVEYCQSCRPCEVQTRGDQMTNFALREKFPELIETTRPVRSHCASIRC